MQLSGAQIVIKFLEDEGIHTLWGYPGGAVLPIYDALETDGTKLDHVLVRHEQAAVHAAEGYAKATGKVGVALLTSGPGATNGVTGIADAYMDSVPLVVITGQVATNLIGTDAFQEADVVGITRSITKHNFLVTSITDLTSILKKAFHLATTGRPGPVVVDIPKDIQNTKTKYSYPEDIDIISYKPTIGGGNFRQINKAIQLIQKAKKPIVYAGGGAIISNSSSQLYEFAQLLQAPVTNTLMGLGSYPGTDDLFVGMLGMHGTYEANMAMHESDLVIAVGARFDDRVTGVLEKFCPNAKFIHIDVDPTSISKNVLVDVPIVGDVTKVLINLNEKMADKSQGFDFDQKEQKSKLQPWWDIINNWRKKNSLGYEKSGRQGIVSQEVIDIVYQITKGEAYVTSDVGQHQMYVAQHYIFDKPRRWINSGGLGTMGFGLPAAMGVAKEFPDKTVVCFSGDGSIQMNIQELSTCLQYGLNVKVIILNNGYLGMVRQWQEMFYDKRYSMSYMESLPDFVKLAEAYGHIGVQLSNPDTLEEDLRKVFEYKNRLVFVDVLVHKTDNVFPMIPGGAGHNEMIIREDAIKNSKDNV